MLSFGMTPIQYRILTSLKSPRSIDELNVEFEYAGRKGLELVCKQAIDSLLRHKAVKKEGKDKFLCILNDQELTSLPAFLDAKSRKPLTPEQRKAVDEKLAVACKDQDYNDPLKPRGMPVEQWEAFKKAQAPKRAPRAAVADTSAEPRKAATPNAEGLIGIASIAEELGIDPRAARAILRSAKVAKPAKGGWSGDAAWADTIRTCLRGGRVRGEGKTSPRKSSRKLVISPPTETTWSSTPAERAKNKRMHKDLKKEIVEALHTEAPHSKKALGKIAKKRGKK